QRQKHQFMVDSLHIHSGSIVLDMGCGWGPFLTFIRKIGAKGIGLTLSEAQHAACRKNGLEVYLKDCRTVTPSDYGMFDAISSVGAFEHFCSQEEYRQGKADLVYSNFFKTVYDLLPAGGRFFLQTMVFGKNMIPIDEVSINAEKNSDAYILALMEKQFPGSWLPYGSEQVIRTASSHFKLISLSSGRLDYIETIKQWRKRFYAFNPQKYLIYASLLPKYFTSSEMRYRAEVLSVSPNKVCFERELMEHYRFVFEKV
ncbi:MAG TPA: class I SAM-dependent methyltransferase, partial [Cyclobacteriaceae bacterium]|nr:class I SAM-dependent methyltransferase [Cyclobacteriaceae bacterium]